MTLLKHVADVRVSNIDKKSYDGEKPVRLCNYTDVYHGDSLSADTGQYMAATASFEQIRRFRLAVGDSVLTKDSETAQDIGISAYIEKAASDFVCGYHLAIVRPLVEAVDPKFLFWCLRSTLVREQLEIAATGVTRFGLRTEAMTNAMIPIPTVAEQRRISDFLDDQASLFNRLLTARQEQMSLVRGSESAAIATIFEGITSSSPTVPLKRMAISIEQGSSPQCENMPAAEGEWGVLKLSAVKRGRFQPEENKRLPAEISPVRGFEVHEGDLLVTRANTPALVGDIAVTRGVRPRLQLSDLIYRVRLNRDVVPEFVALNLLAPSVRGLMSSLARGTSQSMVKLRGEDILALPIPLVTSGHQAVLGGEFTATLARVDYAEDVLAKSQRLLQERKQALITAAVTGQFDVTTARRIA